MVCFRNFVDIIFNDSQLVYERYHKTDMFIVIHYFFFILPKSLLKETLA